MYAVRRCGFGASRGGAASSKTPGISPLGPMPGVRLLRQVPGSRRFSTCLPERRQDTNPGKRPRHRLEQEPRPAGCSSPGSSASSQTMGRQDGVRFTRTTGQNPSIARLMNYALLSRLIGTTGSRLLRTPRRCRLRTAAPASRTACFSPVCPSAKCVASARDRADRCPAARR